MRRPAKIAGSAAGNISLRSRVQRLACVQREQVVHPALGRLQSEQGVEDDREEGDDHADDHPRGLELVPNQNADQRRRGPGSGRPAARPCRGRRPARASLAWLISMAMPMPRTMAMASPMSATLALDQRAVEDLRWSVVPVEEPDSGRPGAAAAAGTGGAASSSDVGDEVPDADDDRAEQQRGQHDARHQCSRLRRRRRDARRGRRRRRFGARRERHRRRRAPGRDRRRSSGAPLASAAETWPRERRRTPGSKRSSGGRG